VGGGAFADDEGGDGIFPILMKMICTVPCHHFTILKLSNRRWFVSLQTIITFVCVMMM
jgi:hypothetical protein